MTEDDKEDLFKMLNETDNLESMTMDEIGQLTLDQELLVKAAIFGSHQDTRIHHLEHLIVQIKMLVDGDKAIDPTIAILQIKEILENVIVEKMSCNGDCNNCDLEH